MSMFANAKALPTEKPSAKKDKKDEVVLKGLEQLAEVDALLKTLTGLKKTLENDVKSEAFDHFFGLTRVSNKRPDNFRGIDGNASASVEMRKRSTASALSPEEIALFEKYNIPTQKVVAVQRLFGINPIYANDDKLLEKVSKALESIVPDNFIVVQEEVSKVVVGDETIDKVFETKAPMAIIEAVTVMALKPKLENTDISKIIEDVTKMINPKKEVITE